MCAIVGALLANVGEKDLELANGILNHIIRASRERGRDGWGYEALVDESDRYKDIAVPEKQPLGFWSIREVPQNIFKRGFHNAWFAMNLRAEPTTEYVAEKSPSDQQPYTVHPFTVVHNGTIANDKERRTYQLKTKIDSAAIPEFLSKFFMNEPLDSMSREERLLNFKAAMETLEGSWAVIAAPRTNSKELLAGTNYRPVWGITTRVGFFFASSRSYFPPGYIPEMLTPYSYHLFGIGDDLRPYHLMKEPLRDYKQSWRALVVCSGGLDSTVAAAMAAASGYEVHLIHFEYGSRAQGPEVAAVKAIAERLGVGHTIFPLPVYKPSDSPLLQADSAIAGGEQGAEFAHEWVPARNLLLLAVATAYAEANGYGVIILGNNLEEAGAYPDNEPEFVHRFNDLLPFAIGANKKIRVAMPVGNLMKHEIVREGLAVGAPLDLTWSCYRAGEKHCGTCGPCFMRRTAFQINNTPEVIEYER